MVSGLDGILRQKQNADALLRLADESDDPVVKAVAVRDAAKAARRANTLSARYGGPDLKDESKQLSSIVKDFDAHLRRLGEQKASIAIVRDNPYSNVKDTRFISASTKRLNVSRQMEKRDEAERRRIVADITDGNLTEEVRNALEHAAPALTDPNAPEFTEPEGFYPGTSIPLDDPRITAHGDPPLPGEDFIHHGDPTLDDRPSLGFRLRKLARYSLNKVNDVMDDLGLDSGPKKVGALLAVGVGIGVVVGRR